MANTTYNDNTQKVGITLPNSLLKQMNRVRGDVPRSTYIRRAVEYYLKQVNVCTPKNYLQQQEQLTSLV